MHSSPARKLRAVQKMPRTFRAEKEFGLIVGAVFSLLGVWWLYRGKFLPLPYFFELVGWTLIFLGLFVPRLLSTPRKIWMKLAEGMAFVSSRIILALIFFLVLTPIGLVKRATGWDPLERRAGSRDSFWIPYSPRQRDPRHYEKMF
jgi:Saxitoxin biosynthesis operon protein SxtJ